MLLDDIVGGGTPSKSVPEYFQGSIPLMTVKDMKVSRPSQTGFNITEAALADSSAKVVPADTIIIATRMGLGKVVRPKMATAINQDLKALFPKEALDKSFLEQWLLSAASKIEAMGTGTTVKGIRLNQIRELEFVLPPINEQRRIVDKIETLFADLDKGEETLRAVQKQLVRYRQSVLKAAVTGELTADWRAENGAAEWRKITLGELAEFLTSGSRGWAKYYSQRGDIFVRAQNIKYDRLDLSDIAYVSLPQKSEGTRTRLKVGDLLITITGANVTKSALVEKDIGTAYVSQHVALFRCTDQVDPEFLYWFVVADYGGRKQLEDYAYGAGKPGLNLQNIKDVKLDLPPLPEQREIVQRIKRLLTSQESLAAELVRQERAANALRQSILKDAFAGKLVPQDPADEPASALLARIKASAPKAVKRSVRKAST
ncbi:restriction endonuclease subunit S [Kordiimonas sp. A6E486]|nr:restriction endonuclease subunit S [Kordiimonas marina]